VIFVPGFEFLQLSDQHRRSGVGIEIMGAEELLDGPTATFPPLPFKRLAHLVDLFETTIRVALNKVKRLII